MTREDFIKSTIKKLEITHKKLCDEQRFFKKSKTLRFYIYKDIFALYAEIITHQEVKSAIKNVEENQYFKINPLIYETFSFVPMGYGFLLL